MTSKIGSFILIIAIMTLAFLTGCERVADVIIDTPPAEDGIPVKLVWLIDYPQGDKDAYIQWVASIAEILQAPQEIRRIRSYDNQNQALSPNRLVEFEFDSFLDAAAYLNRPEIAEVLEDLPNHTNVATVHTYIQRSDYAKTEEGEHPIKALYLIDYPLGGKAAYLQWVDSISDTLIEPTELKAIASYDNYYGASPHRIVELEFSSQADFDAYKALENIQAIEDELDTRTESWKTYTFEIRADYSNQ